MRWNDYWVLCMLTLQWLLVIHSYFNHRRRKRELREMIRGDAMKQWLVLRECAKVLAQHDDFNSRYVLGLITALAREYADDRGGNT